MTLSVIAIIIGLLATCGGIFTFVKPELAKRTLELFPRSKVPGWILMLACCIMGAYQANYMNMGFLDSYKKFIPYIAVGVFAASLFYMKELLSPRALGGFLLLIAVPIVQIARFHESSWRLVIIVLAYIWVVYGIFTLMSPWYFRKIVDPFLKNEGWLRGAGILKAAVGILILLLGLFVY